MVQFLFGGMNYVGPMKELLARKGGHKPRVLDLGTGGGHWLVLCFHLIEAVQV